MTRRGHQLARRTILLTALALTAAALPGLPASGAPACGRAAAAKAGRWYAATPPMAPYSDTHQKAFGATQSLHALGVDPADPRVVVVTDGDHVHRSDDGGCTWREVWRLPETAAADAPGRDLAEITSVDVARVGGRSRVLLAVTATGWGWATGRTYAVRSDDGRTGWSVVGDPVAFAGTFDPQQGAWPPVVHSGSGGVAYAAVPSRIGTVSYARSADGGRTWTAPLPDPGAPTAMTGFAVSPYDAGELWEWGGAHGRTPGELTRLRHSTDGGATWQQVDPWPAFGATRPYWYALDVAWPRAGAPARLVVLGGSSTQNGPPPPVLAWSGDAGRTFQQVVPPIRTSLLQAAVTHTARGDVIVAAPTGETYRITSRGGPPRAGDWRALPGFPVQPPAEWTLLGHDLARASASSPSVVAVRTWRRVVLLTVAP
jgi:hypothetical protein